MPAKKSQSSEAAVREIRRPALLYIVGRHRPIPGMSLT
jgi:hypothetical protein